jgi:hypothetical protein
VFISSWNLPWNSWIIYPASNWKYLLRYLISRSKGELPTLSPKTFSPTNFCHGWDSIHSFQLLRPQTFPINSSFSVHAESSDFSTPVIFIHYFSQVDYWNSPIAGFLTFTLCLTACLFLNITQIRLCYFGFKNCLMVLNSATLFSPHLAPDTLASVLLLIHAKQTADSHLSILALTFPPLECSSVHEDHSITSLGPLLKCHLLIGPEVIILCKIATFSNTAYYSSRYFLFCKPFIIFKHIM